MGLTEMMDSGASTPRPRRRRRRWLGCLPLVLLLVIAAGVGIYLGRSHHLLSLPVIEGCTASTPDGIVDLDVDQMDSAGTITAVSVSRGLPERAATIALATSMQESKLVNLSGGDRDSLGLFQQRPSQGWGTAAQISDPVYATNKFLDRLVAVPGYAQLPLTVAAQDVQHSGYPDAYAQHETDATVLSGALSGRVAAGVTCQVNSVGTAPAATGASALTDRLQKEYGSVVTPRVLSAGSGSTGSTGSGDAASASAAPADPVVSVALHAGATSATQRGWSVAQWAVAHCQDLHLASVQYAGEVWTAADSTQGWQQVGSASAAPSPAGTAGADPTDVLITVAVG